MSICLSFLSAICPSCQLPVLPSSHLSSRLVSALTGTGSVCGTSGSVDLSCSSGNAGHTCCADFLRQHLPARVVMGSISIVLDLELELVSVKMVHTICLFFVCLFVWLID